MGEIYDPIIYGYSIMEQSYRSGQNWNDYKNDFYDLINYRNNFKTNFFYNSELNLENIDISKDTLMKYHNYHIFANLYKIFDDLGDLDSSYKYIKKMNDLNYYGKNFNFEDQKLYLLDLEYRHEYTDEKNGKIIVNEMDSIYSLKIHSENSSKYYLKKFFELDNKLWTQNESYIPLKKTFIDLINLKKELNEAFKESFLFKSPDLIDIYINQYNYHPFLDYFWANKLIDETIIYIYEKYEVYPRINKADMKYFENLKIQDYFSTDSTCISMNSHKMDNECFYGDVINIYTALLSESDIFFLQALLNT